ncbi:hypothetical protein CIL05_07110 [Virgibacillus profundi]|uniref:Uncharacterized protein n=1 Tax=Virgibacillus profundi TaxID=2024555 RepID=A0A2A2IES0_9BACI|nr:hypothetical protein [Virgibacillus profundi]PAV30229.1 hypothetical protein CIL05_07110 [Virgibacillus profundi]PXY54401.1 hypothetical protein CIT14_07195 [Virgibacillus profundi]
MRYIIVDQFTNDDYVNIYVADDKENDFLEIEQDNELPDAYKLIEQFKKEYNINTIEFVLYDSGHVTQDGNNTEIYRRSIEA